MNERIAELVTSLQLLPHPEGGFYRETYRSPLKNNENQSLMTSIYFLLTVDSPSRFHRIKSDEHWYFHEGSPLSIHLLTENGHETLQLGTELINNQLPHLLVKGNTIFGSEVEGSGSYSLVSCAVAPAFDFSTFELFSKEELMKSFPNHSEVITRLT